MSSKRILLAEAHTPTRRLLATALSKGGMFQVIDTGEGESTWAHLEKMDSGSSYALVALDTALSAPNSFEVLKRMRAHPQLQKIPVILMGADDGREQVVAALQQGANAYLIKPVSPAVLAERAQQLLIKQK